MGKKIVPIKGSLFWVEALFLVFLISSPLAWGGSKGKELPLKFGGQVTFKLPFDPRHLSLHGNFKLFNFNLTGDIDIHIMSTSPLRLKFSSNRLLVRVEDLFSILNKLGYLPTPPSYIKGTCIVTAVTGTIEGQNYTLTIGKVKGPSIYGNLLGIKGGNFSFSHSKRLLKYKIVSLKIGKSSFSNIQGIYSPERMDVALNKMKLDIGSLLAVAYSIEPKLRKKILNNLQKYLPASAFSFIGETYINNLSLSLRRKNPEHNQNTTPSLVIHHLEMNVSSPSHMDISISLKKDKTPMHVFIIPGNTHIEMNQNKIICHGQNFKINGKNIFYPLKITQIKYDGVKIPYFSIKNNINISLPLEGNNTSIKINGNISPSVLSLYFRKNTYVEILSSPIQFNLQDNFLNFKLKKVKVTVPNQIYLDLNPTVGIRGDVAFEQILGDILLGKRKSYNVGFNITTSKLAISHPLLSILVKTLNSYIGLTTEKVVIKGAAGDILANKGKIIFSLDTVCPIQHNKVDYRGIYRNTKLKLAIQNVSVKNSKIDMLKLKKTSSHRLNFQCMFHQGDIGIASKGYMEDEDKVINLISSYVKIRDNSHGAISKKSSTGSKEKGFSLKQIPNARIRISFPSYISELSKHYHIELDNFSYSKDREYDIDGLKGDLLFRGKTVALSSEFYFCNLLFSGGVEIQKGTNLGAAFDIRAISMPIDHLLGCFITKAPIYVTGDTNIQVNLSTHGTTYREVVGNLSVDAFLRLDNGRILRLSNLGKKVEMILEVLSFVGLNPSKIEDALPFNKLIVSVSGGVKRLDIKQIQVISPILLLSSGGYFDLEKEKLHLSGTIKKSFLSKNFNLTTFLNSKKGK